MSMNSSKKKSRVHLDPRDLPEPVPTSAQRHELVFGGGAMGEPRSARLRGQEMSIRKLDRAGSRHPLPRVRSMAPPGPRSSATAVRRWIRSITRSSIGPRCGRCVHRGKIAKSLITRQYRNSPPTGWGQNRQREIHDRTCGLRLPSLVGTCYRVWYGKADAAAML